VNVIGKGQTLYFTLTKHQRRDKKCCITDNWMSLTIKVSIMQFKILTIANVNCWEFC